MVAQPTITIPPAALEAGLGAFYIAEADGLTLSDALRAAFLAMLEAWPGMNAMPTLASPRLILPLMENTDDKA